MSALALTAGAEMEGFSVNPVFPDNQVSGTTGFFDLKVVAGQRQEIAVEVENARSTPFTVEIELYTAGTNSNGIIDYSFPGQVDETIAHRFSDLARLTTGTEITVPAHSSMVVPITIDIPEDGFDGVILGSVFVLLGITEEELAEAGMLANRFAYAFAVRLQETEQVFEPDFILGDVRADVVHGRATFVSEIRNPLPRLTMGVNMNAQLYPAGGNSAVFVTENMSVDFAPNTVFTFNMIDFEGFGVQPGPYIMRLQLEHEGKNWDFEREFTVAAQQADNINTAAVNLQQQVSMAGGGLSTWVLAAIIGGALLLVAAVALVIAKMKKSQRATEEAMQRLMEQMQQKSPSQDKTD